MLNPFHFAFTLLGRMLDLLVPRPQARLGPAVAWRSPSSASERVAVRHGRGSRRDDVNRATGTGRDLGARRVTNASPEWAAKLRDAQARANARRIAGSDAAVATWVRALMRDRPQRENVSGTADRFRG